MAKKTIHRAKELVFKERMNVSKRLNSLRELKEYMIRERSGMRDKSSGDAKMCDLVLKHTESEIESIEDKLSAASKVLSNFISKANRLGLTETEVADFEPTEEEFYMAIAEAHDWTEAVINSASERKPDLNLKAECSLEERLSSLDTQKLNELYVSAERENLPLLKLAIEKLAAREIGA